MKDETRLVQLGRSGVGFEQPVNLPVYRASTIMSPDLDSYLNRFADGRRYEKVTYGATGTQNARALADAVNQLEHGAGCMVTASGLSAVTMAISAVINTGDHLLMADTVYGPARRFCNDYLGRMGADTTYFAPGISAADLEALIRPNTKLIYLEAPGSLTFEMQDIPAIVALAKSRGILTAMDNTWATPLYFRPLDFGVDISIQAGTKYIAGHSDVIIGMISMGDEALAKRVMDQTMMFGDIPSPDDCFMTLRGMRTMSVRLERQQRSALTVARWLEKRPEVARVLYPPLESDPGHALWKRDFNGAASLFGVVLKSGDYDGLRRMINGLEHFHIGSSWGGFESLVAVNRTPLDRAELTWSDVPFLLRFHVGLEDPDDLLADLEAGLGRLA